MYTSSLEAIDSNNALNIREQAAENRFEFELRDSGSIVVKSPPFDPEFSGAVVTASLDGSDIRKGS